MRHELEHVVAAVAEHHLLRVDAEPRGERLLERVCVAVRIARDLGGRLRDRRERARARAARVLVGGELDDAGRLEAELARQLLDRLAAT
jgi:hypothetical protein